MTEADWHSSTDPAAMLAFLRDRGVSERKLRLFAVACCRAVWDEGWPLRCRRAVETAERYADGEATDEELNRARSLACQAAYDVIRRASRQRLGHPDVLGANQLLFAADAAVRASVIMFSMTVSPAPHRIQNDRPLNDLAPTILRDIVANRLIPVFFDPSWRTSTAVALARQMYESREFTAMLILGDALEDAGCGDEGVLNHCRGPNVHVRGCWVVDLLLNKS